MHDAKLVSGRMPDRETEYGRAWRCDHLRPNDLSPWAVISLWVVEAGWAHPWWSNYALGAIHLRSEAGLAPANILLENATHEVFLYALDPDLEPDLSDPVSCRLEPANFMGQWVAAGDLDAELKIEKCVEEILAGVLSPDTDHRREWVARFSDSNFKP